MTLRSRIIPCLLMKEGGLVKTKQFSDGKYVGDPLNAVKIFNEKSVDELVFFDIGASVESRKPNLDLLEKLAIESRMPLCYGGGINLADTAKEIISLGFEKISVSSAALEHPRIISEIASKVGSQSVVVTLDVRKNRFGSGYTIYTHNGTRKQKGSLSEFCKQAINLGAGEIVLNSIDHDGMMNGYDLKLASQLRPQISTPMTMVGGAGSLSDIQELIDQIGTVGAGVGSLFVFNGIYRAVLISYGRPDRL